MKSSHVGGAAVASGREPQAEELGVTIRPPESAEMPPDASSSNAPSSELGRGAVPA